MENPGAEYEDVVEFFGNPEDVYVNYIQSRGREEIYSKFQTRKIIKGIFLLVTVILVIIFLILCFYLRESYYFFHDTMPSTSETIINEGEFIYENN